MAERYTSAAALGLAVREFAQTGVDKPVKQALIDIKTKRFTPSAALGQAVREFCQTGRDMSVTRVLANARHAATT